MTRRSELALCAYVLFLVCAGFVQFAHEAWDTTAEPTLMASTTREFRP